MRLDWRTIAGVIVAAVFAVAYSWQPPAGEPRPRANMKDPGPPVPKPSMFEVPKPPDLPRLFLRPPVIQSSVAPPARSPSHGFKHRLAFLWPFRRHSEGEKK
jgi:hypothetical protein